MGHKRVSHKFCRAVRMVGKVFTEEGKHEPNLKIQLDLTSSSGSER